MGADIGWCVKCTLGEPCKLHDERDCAVQACTNPVHSGGRCPTHYRHHRTYGIAREVRPYGRSECLKCDGEHYAKGFCRPCYRSQ